MRLRLADNSLPAYYSLSDAIDDNYITVPDGNGDVMKVRADFFDDMDDQDWEDMMQEVEPLNTGVSGWSDFLSRHRANKADRRNSKASDPLYLQRQQNKAGRRDLIRDVVSNITGAVTGGGQSAMDQRNFDLTGGTNLQFGNQPQPLYKNPLVWVAGGALLIGGYFLLKGKKGKRK